MPTSPLSAPLIPPGSIDTPNVRFSTPGPRLVTPTVTLPVAGDDCGGVLAQAPATTNRAAERERRGAGPWRRDLPPGPNIHPRRNLRCVSASKVSPLT